MGFWAAIRRCLQNYATFSGRATRAEYWWFVLAVTLLFIAASSVDRVLFGFWDASGPVWTIAYLATWLPATTVAVRRLHDRGSTTWHYLVCVAISSGIDIAQRFFVTENLWSWQQETLPRPIGLAIMGALLAYATWLFFALISPSQPGPNRFGPDPFGRESEAAQ